MISPATHQVVGPGYWQYLGPRGRPFIPLPWQREAHDVIRIPWPGIGPDGVWYPTIFGLNCGRRAGKTTIATTLLWSGMLAPDDFFGPPLVRVTADTEEHGRKIWDKFIYQLHNTPLRGLLDDYSRERELVTFKNGANAQLLSANNPNTLSGDGVTLWLVDEAQFLTQAAWDNLFPSTSERNGVIVMIGVSEGEGPFKTICANGDDPRYPEYKRLVYPTAANPYVPKERIAFAQRTMTPQKFAQLYLAQWVDELGKLFRNIRGVFNPDLVVREHPGGWKYVEEPRPGRYYYLGIDLGRLQDWTVVTVWTRDGRLVAWDRYNLFDWELQKSRIAQLSGWFGHPPAMVDSTGIGDPVFDDLVRLGVKAQGYQITTNTKKRALVDEFAIRVGSGQVEIPEIPVLKEEMTRFEAKKSKVENSNVIIYSAPSNGTDDFIISCAMAMQLVPRPEPAKRPVEAENADDARQRGSWESILVA